METSDSECFESADEELYTEDDDTSKISKQIIKTNVQEVEIGILNLGVSGNIEKSNEYGPNKLLGNISDVNSISNKDNEKSEESLYSDNLSNKTIVEEPISQITQLSENVEVTKPVVNLLQLTLLQDDISVNNTSKEINIVHKDPLILEKNGNKILLVPQSKSLNPELESNLGKEIKKNKINDELIVKNLETEENMWDNDDWEPSADKNNLVPEEGSLKIETIEDNMWDNDDWEPIVDSENSIKRDSFSNKTSKNTEDNIWNNEGWESFEKIEPNKSYTNQQKDTETAWSGWGNWGVSSILTTASQGVSTLTNQVSQGISTVLETGMGIPDPKELARQDRIGETFEEQSESEGKANLGFGFGNLSNLVSGVSHITKFVENTGSKVITGGLDTLESIGKKTMEVLQEGDPGLKNKRALLKLDKEKPILSQVLREAKERSERENNIFAEKHSIKKLNYESLFDDFHGLVHLEALEMLSKQCDIKLQTLSENCTGNELREFQETMDQIKELCELPEEDDDDVPTFEDIKEKIQTAVQEINVQITYEKLFSTWQETENWLNNLKLDFCDELEIHQEAVQSLAQLTAIAVEQYHKCGELLLIKEHRSTADEADSLVQLTTAVTSLIGLVAAKFSEQLNTKSSQTGSKDSINELITNVFFEAGNSSSYVQDAFQLLVPVLQIGAV